jgi:hypothetical protein
MLFSTLSVYSQQKYALVIGNAEYTSVVKLRNPVNDAVDMKATLEELGFTVDLVRNGNLSQMVNAAVRLGDNLRKSKDSYGFFYYSGHGVQAGGENYLIPVDAGIPNEAMLKYAALQVQLVLDQLQEAENSLNIVVLDACRDNPFPWKRSAAGRGLTVIGAQPPGSIIVYATSAGQAASDGTDRNGLFTTELLKNLKAPLEIKEVFSRTGADVRNVSKGTQIPAIYMQFFDTAYLAGQAQPENNIEWGDEGVAVGSMAIRVTTAGKLEINGNGISQQRNLNDWGELSVSKVNAGTYTVKMTYSNGKVEEKKIVIGRDKNEVVEFSYTLPLPKKPRDSKPQKVADDARKFWSIGANIGSSFAAPWVMGTIHGTIAPFKYSFFDVGLDIGAVSRVEDARYHSFHPFVHYNLFVPFGDYGKGGFYAGLGVGVMAAAYVFPEGTVNKNTADMDVAVGFKLFDALDIGYTLRTNFKGVSNKVSVGYNYRFKR